eukprot:9481071-Pyramimonas_sp.AAC.1
MRMRSKRLRALISLPKLCPKLLQPFWIRPERFHEFIMVILVHIPEQLVGQQHGRNRRPLHGVWQ